MAALTLLRSRCKNIQGKCLGRAAGGRGSATVLTRLPLASGLHHLGARRIWQRERRRLRRRATPLSNGRTMTAALLPRLSDRPRDCPSGVPQDRRSSRGGPLRLRRQVDRRARGRRTPQRGEQGDWLRDTPAPQPPLPGCVLMVSGRAAGGHSPPDASQQFSVPSVTGFIEGIGDCFQALPEARFRRETEADPHYRGSISNRTPGAIATRRFARSTW